MYLVVSGELLLDTGDFRHEGKIQPFRNSNQDSCFPLSSGSILGDEGVTGENHSFESTAVVVSDAAVVFEAVGFGLNFLTEKICALRYCALSYKDRSKWSAPIAYAEEMNPYTYFNSLRKCIAYAHPYRGSLSNIYGDVPITANYTTEDSVKLLASKMSGGTTTSQIRGKSRARSSMSSRGSFSGKSSKRGSRQTSRMASYMVASQSAANLTIPNGDSLREQYPKTLSVVALNHAVEINKVTKKILQGFIKTHAKVSALCCFLLRIV